MGQKKRVTIYDIARKAGVTTATVSRVINGKHGISHATRARVIEVMRAERYFPSPAASGLRKKSTREIGILSPFFIGDFFLKIFESLHRQLKDYDLILYNAQTPAHRREVIDRIVAEEKLCGLLVASTPVLLEEEELVSSMKIPVVMVEARHPAYSWVDYDHQIGAMKAVSHLVELGHRDIAIIGGKPETRLYHPIGKERLKGYRMALAMAGIPEREELVMSGEWTSADARQSARKLLSAARPPTAIFAASDVQAAGVLMAARELGVRVPEDLSLVGYDNMPFAEYLSLTTMWQHHEVLARNAANLLMEELRTGQRTGERVMLQPELIQRSSTAAPGKRRKR
jgi:LacI family transcriptional regulator, repressor for deo operon, udp, cdd, tsx, nupC, and nupG